MTQALSEIVLSDITTDNTFGLQEYVEVPETVGSWYMTEVKTKLTMEDFLGLEDVTPETGLPSLANMEALGWFTDLFRADYELMGAAVESVDELLEIYLYAGEYSHKEYHPIGNFISGILDVTIIKPFIESIYGKDLITGEKLTDFERGMQLVNAVVGAVTLGQGALAMDFTKMAGKEIAVELLKIWGVDAISDMAAFTVGYTCDELGMPAGVSFIASLLTGCTVSTGISGYVFTDAGGNVVKELDVDEMQAWLKEMDVDLDGPVIGEEYPLYRKKANTGEFIKLKEPMTIEHVKMVCEEGGIGYSGIKIEIVDDPELLGSGFLGYTHPSGQVVELYPDAFTNRENLVKTLGHERMHVMQNRLYGPPQDSATCGLFEAAAQQSEYDWWNYYKSINGGN